MILLDALVAFACAAGLLFFFLERVRYSNINAYRQKLERLRGLEKEIRAIKRDNARAENVINNMDAEMNFDENFTGELIKYSDDAARLETLEYEYRITAAYLNKARPYVTRQH
jgi:type II secretory pathway component PulJ